MGGFITVTLEGAKSVTVEGVYFISVTVEGVYFIPVTVEGGIFYICNSRGGRLYTCNSRRGRGLIYICLFTTWCTWLQKDHIVLSLDDTMSRYNPPVETHRYSIKFVPAVHPNCSTKEILATVTHNSR